MINRFRNRIQAGQLLAKKLRAYANYPDVLVLGLPRGGVPVAYEIATTLNAPLDVCLVRKLGVPGHRELAMGAIATGGIRIINQDVVDRLGISENTIADVAAREQKELERRDRLYRGDRSPPDIQNRAIILVDDGIATGSTIRAAIVTLKQQQPEYIVIATPVAAPSVCHELGTEVNEVVCLLKPDALYAIAAWYDDFTQTTDDEVCNLLEASRFSSVGSQRSTENRIQDYASTAIPSSPALDQS